LEEPPGKASEPTESMVPEDIGFEQGQANVLWPVVDGAMRSCKTEVSQQPVSLDELTTMENYTHPRME
jgi:hypothetical protein